MEAQARITSKGQVTIPKAVRDALGLVEGDTMHFRVEDSSATVSKSPDFVSLAGTVAVPAGKRGTAWDDVLARSRRARSERAR